MKTPNQTLEWMAGERVGSKSNTHGPATTQLDRSASFWPRIHERENSACFDEVSDEVRFSVPENGCWDRLPSTGLIWLPLTSGPGPSSDGTS